LVRGRKESQGKKERNLFDWKRGGCAAGFSFNSGVNRGTHGIGMREEEINSQEKKGAKNSRRKQSSIPSGEVVVWSHPPPHPTTPHPNQKKRGGTVFPRKESGGVGG